MSNIIPVMHCFDNNYVIPAAVSFYSMLEHADKNFEYKLYVLHTDITEENQEKLQETIACFKNAQLEFVNMNNKFADVFKTSVNQAHYSKEVLYKLLAASIFPQYEKIIITDVDVVFLNDIAKEYHEFDIKDDYYLAGFKIFVRKNSFVENCMLAYDKNFTSDEIEKLTIGGGYLIFNLHKIREDNIENAFVQFLEKNTYRILQQEQDVINLVASPKIKYLSPQSVVCSYMYDLYKTEDDFNSDKNWDGKDIKSAMQSPIQLHYATNIKPWKNPSCTKSEIWFEYLLKTPFFNEQMQKFERKKEWYFAFNLLPTLKTKRNKAYLFGFIKIGRLQ